MLYTYEVEPSDGASEVETALQWRGTRADLPEELQNASREEVASYLTDKFSGLRNYAIHEDWHYTLDVTCYADDDENWEHGVRVVCEDEPFVFAPEPGVIEYWCRHYSDAFGVVTCDKNGVANIDELDTDNKRYCVDEGVFWG